MTRSFSSVLRLYPTNLRASTPTHLTTRFRWTAGNHRLKFGGEYRFSQVKFYFNAFSRGQIIYGDTFTGGVRTATAFQNFLQGIGTSLIGSGVYDRYFKITDSNFFVQDDWKINSRLTLNFGLRYDLYGLPVEDQGRLVNFLPDQLRIGTAANPAPPPNGFVQAEGGSLAGVPTVEKTLVPVDKNNFAPRIGFAYLLDKTANIVVRGGYGIYYDRISTRYANTQLFNYPYFALGVGLVNNVLAPILPATFRTSANPFIPLPPPSQFPTAATVPSPLSIGVPVVGLPIAGVFVDPELQTPYVQQYNFGLQGEFANNFVWDFGYVGNRGTHLLQVITLNQPVYNPATNTFHAAHRSGEYSFRQQKHHGRRSAGSDDFDFALQLDPDVSEQTIQRRFAISCGLHGRAFDGLLFRFGGQ